MASKIFQIPAITEKPAYVPITHNLQELCSWNFIVADFETTGFFVTDEICQIAAVDYHDAKQNPFMVLIRPSHEFHPRASLTNGFSISRDCSGERVLSKSGSHLEATSLIEGTRAFFDYLCQKSRPGMKTVVIGYNMKGFDIRMLLSAFKKCEITTAELEACGIGFADAFPLIKEMRENKFAGIQDFKLQTVYAFLFGERSVNLTHDALKDAEHLQNILSHLSVPLERILKHSFTAESAGQAHAFRLTSKRLQRSMESRLFFDRRNPTKGTNVISEYMAQKIAESGLT